MASTVLIEKGITSTFPKHIGNRLDPRLHTHLILVALGVAHYRVSLRMAFSPLESWEFRLRFLCCGP